MGIINPIKPSLSFHNYQFTASLVLSILPSISPNPSSFRNKFQIHIILSENVSAYISKRGTICFKHYHNIIITLENNKHNTIVKILSWSWPPLCPQT